MTERLRIGLTGASGFVGAAVSAAVLASGHSLRALEVPRLEVPGSLDVGAYLRDWMRSEGRTLGRVISCLADCDVVIHAAGVAIPASGPTAALTGGNAALPALLAHAASTAGVRRLVHISSAAVQGSHDPLDETMRHFPLTPYAKSKATGETLLVSALPTSIETVIFRPTSVQGSGREITKKLCMYISRSRVPVFGDGEAPLPLALIENVASAALELALAEAAPPVALYPWEGMTLRRLIDLVSQARTMSIPTWVGRATVETLLGAGKLWPPGTAIGRRLELLVKGQRQNAIALPRLGFTPPVGQEGYRALCSRFGDGV